MNCSPRGVYGPGRGIAVVNLGINPSCLVGGESISGNSTLGIMQGEIYTAYDRGSDNRRAIAQLRATGRTSHINPAIDLVLRHLPAPNSSPKRGVDAGHQIGSAQMHEIR